MSEKTKISLKGVIKDIVVEWFLSSTAHALPNIFRTNSIIIKVIWALCFTACTIYCVITTGFSLKSYLEYNTYITSGLFQETPSQFPAVTVCNTKYTNKTKSKAYIENLLFGNNTPNMQLSTDDTFWFTMSQTYHIFSSISNNLNITEKTALGYDMSDMLLSCTYNWEQCSVNDFIQFFHPMYGNCYTFNSGYKRDRSTTEVRKVNIPGPDYGFSFNLFIGKPENDSLYELFGDGVVVVVHNQSTIPVLNGDRILIPAGSETDIKVNRNFISKLDSPYSDCLMDTTSSSTYTSEYFDYIVKQKSFTYNREYCLLLCYQKKVNVRCNCSLGVWPIYGNDYICTLKEMQCFTFIVYNINKNISTDDCNKGCPLPCNSVEYKVTTSKNVYPSTYYKKLLMQNSKIKTSGISFDDLDRATLRINIFYEALTYTLTQEIASMTSDSFLSNIGGTLGLFLGISILSFVELVELFILIIQTLVQHKLTSKINNNDVINISSNFQSSKS